MYNVYERGFLFMDNIDQQITTLRYWKKVIVKGEDECWDWIGAVGTDKRGIFIFNGKLRPSPRYAWYLKTGEHAPDNKFVCHSCDNPNCVNPKHLWLGTHSDNMIDMYKKNRTKAVERSVATRVNRAKNRDTCKNGHPWTEETIYYHNSRQNVRRCKICRKQAKDRMKQRQEVDK